MPSFICDVILHPLQSLNLKIKYYKINEKFRPLWDTMDSLIDRETKAIFMVHYFASHKI